VAIQTIIIGTGLLMQNDKAILAQWAKNLLNDDFFKEVLNNLKNEQISVIINTSAEESDRREDAYRHIKTLELITGHLEGLASETVIREKKWKIL
jgi:hypothetical protein